MLTQFHRHLKRRDIYNEAIDSETSAFPDMTITFATTFRIMESQAVNTGGS